MTSGSNVSAINRGLAIVAFMVTVAYWPGIAGYAIAPRWAVLAIGLPVLLFFVPRIEMTTVHWVGLAVVGYAFASLAWIAVPVEAVDGLAKMTIVACAFVLGAQATDLKPTFVALAIGLAVNDVFGVLQYFGIHVVEIVYANKSAGLFANQNMYGELAALSLVGALAYRLWWTVPFPALGLILSQCRGAWLGVAIAGIVALWTRSKLGAVAALLALIVAGNIALLIPQAQNALIARGRVWMDAAENLSWRGHGVGQYWVTTPQHAPRQEAMNTRHWHAHNDPIEAVYEYGIAAILCVVFVGMCLAGPLTRERAILAAFLGIGLVGFPLHVPATAFVGALVAGRLARVRHELRCAVDRRSSLDGDGNANRYRTSPALVPNARGCENLSAGSLHARTAGAGSVGLA